MSILSFFWQELIGPLSASRFQQEPFWQTWLCSYYNVVFLVGLAVKTEKGVTVDVYLSWDKALSSTCKLWLLGPVISAMQKMRTESQYFTIKMKSTIKLQYVDLISKNLALLSIFHSPRVPTNRNYAAVCWCHTHTVMLKMPPEKERASTLARPCNFSKLCNHISRCKMWVCWRHHGCRN